MAPTNAPVPWSKKHKHVTRASAGGLPYSLSNSFAEPLTSKELIDLSVERGDQAIVDEYQSHSLAYTPNGGSLDLRREIANLYGPNVSSSDVLVFPGAQIALQTAARALIEADGTAHCITFGPGYQSTMAGPRHVGGDVTTIQLKPEHGWQIDMTEVRDAIRPGVTRYIVLNMPHNPTGTLMSDETYAELRDVASKYGIYILCDEVYRLLEHNGEVDRLPPMADFYDRGISCVTVSKPWGGCGISIGWLVCRDEYLKDRLADVQYFGCACMSRASELQAIMLLRSSDAVLAKNMAIIRHNKTLLEKFVSDYDDLFTWVSPTAGAIAAIKFMGPLTSNELGAKLAAEGIGIKPAYCFTDAVVTEENDYFRVGFGERVMPRALDALRRFVEERKDGWREAMRQS